MKKRRLLLVWLVLVCLLACAPFAQAEDAGEAAPEAEPFEVWLTCNIGGAVLNVQPTQYGDTLFLPAFADLNSLLLDASGQPLVLAAGEMQLEAAPGEAIDLLRLFPQGADEEGVYILTVTAGGVERGLRIRQSSGQPALFITSGDPVNRGRAFVDGLTDPKSETVTDACLLMVNEQGETVYDNELRELRGRGNTTWEWGLKKPYQIKLEKKADLLETGDDINKERTWLLLAESFDVTLTHNMLSLSLGQQLGVAGTPEFRPVDLYYDGDYCGFYLLSEKANVKPGRLDILEMDDVIAERYPQVENESLHPVLEDSTGIGPIRYVSGIDAAFGQQGAYLIELDMYGGFDEESMFQTANGDMYEIRSPEYAGQEDVAYVQQLTNDLVLTAQNGGVHPEDGRLLEELIDIDSLARYLLIQQFAKTCDFGYTSTYLYLPEGSAKFMAGPLWDFDIGYAMRDTRPFEGGTGGWVAQDRWVHAVMDTPSLQESMQRIWAEELQPLIAGVVLAEGEVHQGSLRSLDGYLAAIDASRRMNYDLWQLGGRYLNINHDTLYDTFDENWAYFVTYINERIEWMEQDLGLWSGDVIEEAALRVSYVNADVLSNVTVEAASLFQRTTVTGVEWSSQPDPDVPWRMHYTAQVTLIPREGSRFAENAHFTVNGAEAQLVSLSEAEAVVTFTFSGSRYVPAEYEGVDYGLLFDYDYYVDQYPELLEECGEDPYALLENYVYYDLPIGISAIESFDYDLYYECYMPLLEAYFFSDTYESTMFYLINDQQELMLGMGERIVPSAEEFVPAGE